MTRVAFKTIGCRLNQAETASMRARFQARGFEPVAFGGECELCVIHTCAVTAAAVRKCVSAARSCRRHAPGAFVVMAGCGAEVDSDGLSESSGADLVVGQSDKARLVEILESRFFSQNEPPPSREARVAIPSFETTRALVKVQDGCSFGCAYCIVPRTRGPAHSRPMTEIVEEITALAEQGHREIVLTGANLGCYRDERRGLVELLEAAKQVPGVLRLRISSIEVSTVEREVVDRMAASDRICNYLHVPLQTADDDLLRSMGRRYTSDEYRSFVKYALTAIPLLGLGTDIVVGLPGETGQAFENTVRFVQELPFGNLHVFPYSRREGTRASQMDDQVPSETRKARVQRLASVARARKQSFAEQFLGRDVEVLVERVADDGSGSGWTAEYVAARIEPPCPPPNSLVRLRPASVRDAVLCGSVLSV